MDGHEAEITDALRVAALVKAPFISVESDEFWTSRILNTEGYEDSSPAAERLLKEAEVHNRSLMSVMVSWVAEGLVYQWTAQSDWIGPLLVDIDSVVEAAAAETHDEHRASLREYYTSIQTAATILAESWKYRGEPSGKRRHLMASVLAEAGMDEIDGITLTRQVMPEANRIVNARVYEFEQDFRARKAQIAEELQNYPVWQGVYTKAKRKEAAMEFLAKKADGHRLSTNLAEEISEAAANPVYVSRY